MNEKMDKYLPWITEWMNENIDIGLFSKEEFKILNIIKEKWNKTDRIVLLNTLKLQYGDIVKTVLNKFLQDKTEKDWASIGKEHGDNSLNSFMKILWSPNFQDGFEYYVKKDKGQYQVKCVKCPMFKLANELDAHEWIFELACMSDYYMVNGFNNNIVFTREKTLVEGYDYCNHTYRMK